MASSHFKALMKKNWILFKRSWFCSTMEVMVPILFILILVLFRKTIEKNNIPEKSYLSAINVVYLKKGITKNNILLK